VELWLVQVDFCSLAAGAKLTIIVDTIIPEAFSQTRRATGLVAVLGFLTAFYLTISIRLKNN